MKDDEKPAVNNLNKMENTMQNDALGYSIKQGFLEFFFRDTGIGIEKEKQQRIFEPFRQEDYKNTRGYEGSGLGLSIVKGLATLLGGKVAFIT